MSVINGLLSILICVSIGFVWGISSLLNMVEDKCPEACEAIKKMVKDEFNAKLGGDN